MSDPIFINELKGVERLIARFCDDGDGKLEENNSNGVNEISLFNAKMENYRSTKQDISVFNEKYVAPCDKTRVALPRVEMAKATNNESDEAFKKFLEKAELSKKMKKKWCNANTFAKSPLSEEFFTKLYDVMEILKVKIPESQWNKEVYDSPKEQAFDEVIAIFAGEAQLNPKLIGYVMNKKTKQRVATYYGLFQMDSDALGTVKQWAKKHPNVPGMKNIKQNMTLTAFRNLKGEEQLDYLIAYIGASREGSKISANAELTPAKLWSMIKLPNLDENDPDKKTRREKTIAAKQDAIQEVFRKNKVPHGVD